jgi:hypothetical protein
MLLLVAAGLTRLAALAQLGLLPLSVDRVDGAARAMMLSATEKNIKDTARIFFIDFGLVEDGSRRASVDMTSLSTPICINKSGIFERKSHLSVAAARRPDSEAARKWIEAENKLTFDRSSRKNLRLKIPV